MLKKESYPWEYIGINTIGSHVEKVGWHDYETINEYSYDYSFDKPKDFYSLNDFSCYVSLNTGMGDALVASYEYNGTRTEYWDVTNLDYPKEKRGNYLHWIFSNKKYRNDDYRLFFMVTEVNINEFNDKIKVNIKFKCRYVSGGPLLWIRLPHYFITDFSFQLSIWYEDRPPVIPIKPKNIEDPNNQKWQFYINFQKQTWFNKLLTNEEINLLPIENKKYDYENSFLKTINDLSFEEEEHKYQLENITLFDIGNNQIESKFINTRIIFKIDDNNNSVLYDKKYCDDIFKIVSSKNEEITEKFDNLYYYVIIKGNKSLVVNRHTVDFTNQPNTHFILPINQIGLKNSDNDLLGWKNTFDNIKNELSGQSITAFFSSPLSPFQIAFYNRDNIFKLLKYLPSVDDTPYNINENCGFFLWDDYLVIPITEEVIKIWIDSNVFVNKTFNYLELINNNKTKLPTKWENEPILFSPQCLITYIKSISNNFNPIGNDLFDLRYQILYMGLITTMLVNNTVMLHLNHFNPQRVLSMSKNELCTTINGELPYKTNAWTDWLDTHQTTQDTSYKIYNLTANQRKDNYETQQFIRTTNYATSTTSNLLGGAINLGLGIATGGLGIAGSIASNFLKNLPTNISKGTLQSMENSRNISGMLHSGTNLLSGIGQAISGGLVLQKQNQNAYNQMTTNNLIDKLNLDSQFANIRLSSGKDFILPSFQSGAFAQNSGLYLYTLEAKPEFKKQIGIDRLMNGVPVNQILNYNNYDNRQVYNIICLNPSFNFVGIFDIIKKGLGSNKLMSKFNREYIEYFMKNYLSGMTIFKNYKDWIPQHWKIENNYENDINNDEDNLDDE